MIKNVPYVDLSLQWEAEKEDLAQIFQTVASSGNLVGGPWCAEFEDAVSRYCGAKYAVALNSGTDALVCALVAVGVRKGDEVITPPNSFVASTAAITHIGAIPVFVDVEDDQTISASAIATKISKKTRAIMPVHLTGRMAKMDEIKRLADANGIPIIEDAAQAIGSKYKEISSGTYGQIGCFSTHPLKNLNALGDGGFIVTNNEEYYLRIKSMRSHGLVDRNTVLDFGYVSRMDSIQAAILLYRLKNLDKIISIRRDHANTYFENLNRNYIYFPDDHEYYFNTYHTFVIQVPGRDRAISFLSDRGIGTAIHYPVPIHLQPAYRKISAAPEKYPKVEEQSKKILSLPIHQYLSKESILYVSQTINEFFELDLK